VTVRDRLTAGYFVHRAVQVAAGLLVISLALVLFLPRPRRSSPHGPWMACSSNLRMIGLAIRRYAQDHGEAFPPDFGALYPDYIDNPKLFSCRAKPSEWQRIQKTGEARPEWTSYVYVAGITDSDDTACVLAFDRPGNHGEDGLNVLFLDTHVEWCTFEEFEQHLAKTRALGRQSGREIRLVGE
jgi:prepilin-type processing-associated H-X9-DG protein